MSILWRVISNYYKSVFPSSFISISECCPSIYYLSFVQFLDTTIFLCEWNLLAVCRNSWRWRNQLSCRCGNFCWDCNIGAEFQSLQWFVANSNWFDDQSQTCICSNVSNNCSSFCNSTFSVKISNVKTCRCPWREYHYVREGTFISLCRQKC